MLKPRLSSASSSSNHAGEDSRVYMALSSYSTMNWPMLSEQYHGIITSPRAVAEAPQLLAATALPGYSNANANAACGYSALNNMRHHEAVKADPSFFSKDGYSEYSNSHDAELADDYSYVTDYWNHYNTYAHDELLDPAAADFSSAIDSPSLGIWCENNDHHLQQPLLSGPGLPNFHDNYGANLDQFYPCQAPLQPSKRHKSSYFDCPELFFAPNNPHPSGKPPGSHANGAPSKLTNVEEDMEYTKPRPRRVSAQSLAARERRKKITDKTQELGKLIPGGNKMNTAEMLHSAFNYVKFLQSQLHILQLMSTLNSQDNDHIEGGTKETDKEKGLSANLLRLVSSPAVQEKLYKEGSCIIPRSLVKTLIHLHPHLQDLQQLL